MEVTERIRMLKRLVLHIAQLVLRNFILTKKWLVIAICTLVVSAIENYTLRVAIANASFENSLLDLSIEELMDIRVVRVSSVSRNEQKLMHVASAIYVITDDDIQRSGVTSIPDALRMAPGVQVARISTDKWAVSIRGFNGLSSSKVQVLVDGRSDYSPIFIGAVWAQQDTLIEDVKRIEIIRGPAASVWGTNAVNGVINIITKHAADTQGTLLTAGGGSFERGFLSARYGGKLNQDTPFRIYAKGFSRDSTRSLSGTHDNEQWHSARAGFRIDHDHANNLDQFTLQGEYFYNALGYTLDSNALDIPAISDRSQRGDLQGGYLRFRWDRALSDKSALWLQAAYDRSDYQFLPVSKYSVESVDIDFQHHLPLFEKHKFTWGGHYRANMTKVDGSEVITFMPPRDTNHFFSGFVRGDFTLIPDRLLFAIGTRLDHNEFSGLEIQPNARLTWSLNDHQAVWVAVSRAVRTPSRSESDALVNLGFRRDAAGVGALPIPVLSTLSSGGRFNSEKLLAYELGYRHQFSSSASIDVAGFINDYSDLRDFGFGAISLSAGLPQHFVLPLILNNKASALTYGTEVSVDWRPVTNWRLHGNYSYLNMHVSASEFAEEFDSLSGAADRSNPRHQFSIRSDYDFSEKLQLNLWLRYTSKIPYYGISDYVTMDAKLAFRPTKDFELFLVGQNLFAENHREFVSDIVPTMPARIPRGIYAGARWRF